VTIIDADTGEIVSSTALERPRLAEPGQPIALAQLIPQCRSIEVWAERTESVAEVKDAAHKLDAIGRYIAATSKDGCAVVAATQRRLEARIGVLLGKASRNGGNSRNGSSAIDPFDDLTKDERSAFRKMADHPDIVEVRRNIRLDIATHRRFGHPEQLAGLTQRHARAGQLRSGGADHPSDLRPVITSHSGGGPVQLVAE
jgi:hypothetical protein